MTQLISPQQAADQIGVSIHQVYAWIRRADDPLPSLTVGQTGKFRKVIAEAIGPWLEAEATRKVLAS